MNALEQPRISPAVGMLLAVNVGVYLLEILPGIGPWVLDWGSLVPAAAFTKLQIWRLVSYMFIHDPQSPFHLLFNMLALWMFGREIEIAWGTGRFTRFYLIGGVCSGCFSMLHLFSLTMSRTGVIGASGAVLALLTVYASMYPHRQVLLFFVVPVNIRVIVAGYALISLFGSISSSGVVSHITHLGGIVVAICYLKMYPMVSERLQLHAAGREERLMRRKIAAASEKKRFYDDIVDPILEKISREGISALSRNERNILKKVAASKERSRVIGNKIIPLDFFR